MKIEENREVADISLMSVLLYGPEKIGKSSFAASLPNALFIDIEGGLKLLKCSKVSCPDWNSFKSILSSIPNEKSIGKKYTTLVIDTLDFLYLRARKDLLLDLKIRHESELGYGKGFDLVRTEFQNAMMHLISLGASMGFGVWFICNSTEELIQTRAKDYTRFVPNLPEKVRRPITKVMDFIFFMYNDDDKEGNNRRVIYTKPHQYYDAGDRTGRLPNELPVDFKSVNEALNNAIYND